MPTQWQREHSEKDINIVLMSKANLIALIKTHFELARMLKSMKIGLYL